MTNVTVVVGAQFGSEGKGAIAGFLGRSMTSNDLAVRVAGPNAGHTAYDEAGREWKLRALPVAAVTSKNAWLHIAAGSEIDPFVLMKEINAVEEAGHMVRKRLSIHPSATILEPRHQDKEGSQGIVGRIGSTGKGIGAARADRIWRRAVTFGEFVPQTSMNAGKRWWEQFLAEQPHTFDYGMYGRVVVEGTQGYGLGLHTPFYPTVTSSDCRAVDFLAMAGISPWATYVSELNVILVARVYPIRVAGPSGPLKGETTWGELGLPEEHTTVTHKVRRVGEWDEELLTEAIIANGGGNFNPHVSLALTMLDQKFPTQRDRTELDDEPLAFVEALETKHEINITHVGTGPNTVVEL